MFSNMILLLLAASACHAASFPQTIEVDLVFPRNETYAPLPYFPLVFAVQNSAMALPLGGYISWDMVNLLDPNDWLTGEGRYFLPTNATPTEPFFHIANTLRTHNTTGHWRIIWYLELPARCNATNPSIIADGYMSPRGILEFSTVPGAKLPDIKESGVCPAPVAFGIDNFFSSDEVQGGACVAVADTPAASHPCDVKVDDSLVETVTQKLQQEWSNCTYGTFANVTGWCQPDNMGVIPRVSYSLLMMGVVGVIVMAAAW